METKVPDTALDPLITALIPVATRVIADWTEREFVPTAGLGSTRRFAVRSSLVPLAPFDLQSVSSVTWDPAGSPATVASTDYRLLPETSVDGVHSSLLLSGWVFAATATSLAFGFNEIDVTGTWGFPAVPVSVRQAAVVSIRSWLRRDLDSYGQVADNGMRVLQPQPFGTYKLPAAAKAMLDPFCRPVLV